MKTTMIAIVLGLMALPLAAGDQWSDLTIQAGGRSIHLPKLPYWETPAEFEVLRANLPGDLLEVKGGTEEEILYAILENIQRDTRSKRLNAAVAKIIGSTAPDEIFTFTDTQLGSDSRYPELTKLHWEGYAMVMLKDMIHHKLRTTRAVPDPDAVRKRLAGVGIDFPKGVVFQESVPISSTDDSLEVRFKGAPDLGFKITDPDWSRHRRVIGSTLPYLSTTPPFELIDRSTAMGGLIAGIRYELLGMDQKALHSPRADALRYVLTSVQSALFSSALQRR